MKGSRLIPDNLNMMRCPLLAARPHVISRALCDSVPSRLEREFEPTPSGGLVDQPDMIP